MTLIGKTFKLLTTGLALQSGIGWATQVNPTTSTDSKISQLDPQNILLQRPGWLPKTVVFGGKITDVNQNIAIDLPEGVCEDPRGFIDYTTAYQQGFYEIKGQLFDESNSKHLDTMETGLATLPKELENAPRWTYKNVPDARLGMNTGLLQKTGLVRDITFVFRRCALLMYRQVGAKYEWVRKEVRDLLKCAKLIDASTAEKELLQADQNHPTIEREVKRYRKAKMDLIQELHPDFDPDTYLLVAPFYRSSVDCGKSRPFNEELHTIKLPKNFVTWLPPKYQENPLAEKCGTEGIFAQDLTMLEGQIPYHPHIRKPKRYQDLIERIGKEMTTPKVPRAKKTVNFQRVEFLEKGGQVFKIPITVSLEKCFLVPLVERKLGQPRFITYKIHLDPKKIPVDDMETCAMIFNATYTLNQSSGRVGINRAARQHLKNKPEPIRPDALSNDERYRAFELSAIHGGTIFAAYSVHCEEPISLNSHDHKDGL